MEVKSPKKEEPEAPPTFQELQAPGFPLLPVIPTSRLCEVVESDMNILQDQAQRLKQAWDWASPYDIDGTCKLMNMTFKLIEMRRKILLLPLGMLSDRGRGKDPGSSYDSLYDD